MIIRCLFLAAITLISLPVRATELHVFAPKSVKSVMIEISEIFKQNNSGWKVDLRTDRSPTLAQLISQGSNADIFLMDDEDSVKELKEKKFIENVIPFLADDLVIVASAQSKLTITDPSKLFFPDIKGVALFEETTPLGKSSREYLKKINVWDSVKSKIGIQENSKSLIKSLQAGDTDWGILHQSDVAQQSAVKVLWIIPEKDLKPNRYYLGSVSKSTQKEGVRKFLDVMKSTIAAKVFENAGLRIVAKSL
jgi:molybdenum ABC transporter molybdate-binding protein